MTQHLEAILGSFFDIPRPPHQHSGYNRHVLYLDYDGVLHPDDVWRSRGRRVKLGPKSAGHTLFEYCEILESALSPYPDVQIILSTSWVRVLRFRTAVSYLPQSLREKVIGATYHSVMPGDWFNSLTRGAQVLSDVSRRKPEAWVAVDDSPEGWTGDSKNHLVQCNSDIGLADPAVQIRLGQVMAKNFSMCRSTS